MTFAGAALVVLAVAGLAAAYAVTANAKRAEARAAGAKRSALPPGGVKPVVLAFAGGLLMALANSVVGRTRSEFGLGPYALALFFCGGVFVSTILYSIFFMNLPVQGLPLDLTPYLKAGARRHGLGLLGGILWCAGSLALWVVVAAPPETHLTAGKGFAIAMLPPLIAGTWGLLWNEFAGARGPAKAMTAAAYVIFIAGIAVMAIA
jgi:glucose uptake protein